MLSVIMLNVVPIVEAHAINIPSVIYTDLTYKFAKNPINYGNGGGELRQKKFYWIDLIHEEINCILGTGSTHYFTHHLYRDLGPVL